MKLDVFVFGAMLITAFLSAFNPVFGAKITAQYSSVIKIDGVINKESVEDFHVLAEKIPDWCVIELNSSGGDVVAALDIGRIIRSKSCRTVVAELHICASACIFIVVAGEDREIYGKIGIHRPHFDDSYFAGLTVAQAREKYRQLEIETSDYLHDMGMPDELFIRMMRIPSYSVQWLSSTDVINLGINGIDPAYEEWLQAKYVQQFGPEGYRRHQEGLALFNKCINTEPTSASSELKCQQDITRRYPEAMWSPRIQ